MINLKTFRFKIYEYFYDEKVVHFIENWIIPSLVSKIIYPVLFLKLILLKKFLKLSKLYSWMYVNHQLGSTSVCL